MTPPYASIEQIDGCDPDPRDDIYALACVTYELLTGRHPFNRVPARRALTERMEPVRPPNLNRRQWEGLKRALAFHRDERTPSIAVFIAALEPRRKGRTWPAALAIAAFATSLRKAVRAAAMAALAAVGTSAASLRKAMRAAAVAAHAAAGTFAASLRKAMRAGAVAARAAAQAFTALLRKAIGAAAVAPADVKAAFAFLKPRQPRRALIALGAAVALIPLAAGAWWVFEVSTPPPPRNGTEAVGPVFPPPSPQAVPEPVSPPPEAPPTSPPEAAPPTACTGTRAPATGGVGPMAARSRRCHAPC